ncbi:MAG TPA: hypothetical protein VJ990_03170 [Clostridia bacterium]|nr:hypothetical protein [Clostridia bacterium]
MNLSPSFIMGFGIGLITAVLLMTVFSKGTLSDYELETKARDLGMIYPVEFKAGEFCEEGTE